MTDAPNTYALGGIVSGAERTQDWQRIFGNFSDIVLVGNSGAVDIQLLCESYPDTALFIFFNKVYKSLDNKFDRSAMLISRAQPKGANIVYRGEVKQVLNLFERRKFLGVLNLRLEIYEKLNTQADYCGVPTGHVDLSDGNKMPYPNGKTPTSGFALSLWLAEMRLAANVHLVGFSARRTEKWKLVSVHDWNFEQTCFRLLAKTGRITLSNRSLTNPYQLLADKFPEIARVDIALDAIETVSDRLGNTDHEVNRLISLTAVNRSVDRLLRSFKPKWFRQRT